MGDRGERNRTEGMVLGNRLRMGELEMVRFARKTGAEFVLTKIEIDEESVGRCVFVFLLSGRSCSCLRILLSLCTSPDIRLSAHPRSCYNCPRGTIL